MPIFEKLPNPQQVSFIPLWGVGLLTIVWWLACEIRPGQQKSCARQPKIMLKLSVACHNMLLQIVENYGQQKP